MIEVAISADERRLLERPVVGAAGGFQNLLRSLREGVRGERLHLSQEHARRLVRYVRDYGDGGWQARLRPLAVRVEAALARVPDERGEDMLA